MYVLQKQMYFSVMNSVLFLFRRPTFRCFCVYRDVLGCNLYPAGAKQALISLSDKRNLELLANGLGDLGYAYPIVTAVFFLVLKHGILFV